MNISGEDFFKTSINLTPKLKDSVSYQIRSHCKIMVIKPTVDTQELRKYILILDNQYYAPAIEKLGKLFDYLQKNKPASDNEFKSQKVQYVPRNQLR